MAKWTEEEVKFIKDNYRLMSDEEMSKILTRHTQKALTTKRKKLRYIHDVTYNKKYTFEDVVYEFSKTKYELLSTADDYINAAENTLKYICPRHRDRGIQTISLGHLQMGRGCYYCGRERTEAGHLVNPYENDKESRNLAEDKGFEYVGWFRNNGKLYINFICPHHRKYGIQSMKKGNMKREQIIGCPHCRKTTGENKVEKVLGELNIKHIYQHKFEDCCDIRPLPFDFYLPDLNAVIEYDGAQHYIPIRFGTVSQEDAERHHEYIQRHDRIKNEYCKNNNISMLRIPYTDFNNIENLIKNFIYNL